MSNPQTLLDKIWEKHTVTTFEDGRTLLYIDRHLLHEVTSPQAFAGLTLAKRSVRRPNLTFATIDHCIPTIDQTTVIDLLAKHQIEELRNNCSKHAITLFDIDSGKQGIIHIIGPELGLTLPGTTIVCGDSHTATHGAFGALAFGIGTSEVEHVLATQCLLTKKPKNYCITFTGKQHKSVMAKDLVLYLIGQIGTAGATEHVFEFTGEPVKQMSMEERMTLCNMSIEAGARAGLIAPDNTTASYFQNTQRTYAPDEMSYDNLFTDPFAIFDSTLEICASHIAPQVTWGTSPGMVCGIDEAIPNYDTVAHTTSEDAKKALDYMGLKPKQKISDIPIDVVFIGSCTNGRIEDLRLAAQIINNNKIHSDVTVIIVPGSQAVKKMAEQEGLDKIFLQSGAQWREPGCSLCLAMNPDKLKPGERCAATSNRNFEGRQGKGSRTHLVSPAMAAAAAIHGHFVDVRELS
ncbi:MAG: 3-isopropylmalate dehydratase large subunit [bacterium]|nr:3-isopropylmalate dehydratase large subunit [bacterium]